MSIRKGILSIVLCGCLTVFSACGIAGGESSASSDSASADGSSVQTSAGGSETEEKPTEPTAYSEEVKTVAKTTIIAATEECLRAAGSSLTAEQKAKAERYIDGYVTPVFEAEGISELKFYALIRGLAARKEKISAGVLSLYGQGELTQEDLQTAFSIYEDCTAVLGQAALTGVAYALLVARHEAKIAEYEEKYERTGYGYYLDYIAAEAADKATLTEEIGRRDFCALMGTIAEILDKTKEIWLQKESVSEKTQYTDEEIAAFVSVAGYRLKDLSIAPKGWAACLRFAGKTLTGAFGKNADMGRRMLFAAMQEDGDSLGEVMGETVKLLSEKALRLSVSDVSSAREKGIFGLLSKICAALTDEEKEVLRRATSVRLHDEKYRVMIEAAGKTAEYEAYFSAGEAGSFESWTESAGTDDFEKTWEAYLLGRYPYFAYAFFA